MKRKILITGVGGFIGYHLALKLTKNRDYFVIGVDNFERGSFDHSISDLVKEENFELIIGDLNHTEFVSSLPTEIDYVYHLATINGTQNFYSIPFDVAVSCVMPTRNLIEHYKHQNSLKFILAGTPESYATSVEIGFESIPTSEDVVLSISSPLEPRWSYAAGKIFAEVLVANAAKQFGLKFLITRFHNIYGPRMGPHHFIPDFLERVKLRDFTIYGGLNTRSFLYVTDAVSDLISLAEQDAVSNEIFNIGSREEISISDLAKIILSQLDISVDLNIAPAPTGSVSRRVPDTNKIDSLLGHRSRISLEEGIKECLFEFFPSNTFKDSGL